VIDQIILMICNPGMKLV